MLPSGVHTLQLNEVTGGYNISRVEFNLLTASAPEATEQPGSFALMQNYPNPFNPATMIQYTVGGARDEGRGTSTMVRLSVYDILGREVKVLVNEVQAPGQYSVRFDGAGLSSGMYLYRLEAGSFTEVKRMVLLK